MLDASNMIRTIQNNKGSVICCPELIAYNQGWITDNQLLSSAELMKKMNMENV